MAKIKLNPKDLALTLREAKRCESPGEMRNMLQQIFKNPILKNYTKKVYFPKTAEDIKKLDFYLPSKELENELLWTSAVLSVHAEAINDFLKMEKIYDTYLLTGRYDDALKIIEALQAKCGVSYWSLEQQINLYELRYGTDIQRGLTTSLTENKNIHPGVKLLLIYAGWRAEKTISYRLYNFYFRRIIKETDGYFWLKTNYYGTTDFGELAEILIQDDNAPIIDIYDTYLRICQHLFTLGNPEMLQILGKSLRYVNKIEDYRLTNLRVLLLHEFEQLSVNETALNILDNYTMGRYEDVVSEANRAFGRGDIHPDYAEILVRSCIRANLPCPNFGETLLGRIVNSMYRVLIKDEKYQEAVDDLQKLVCTFQTQTWSARINSFLLEERYSKETELSKLGFLNTFVGNPRQGYYIRQNKREGFFDRLKHLMPISPTISLHAIMIKPEVNVSEIDNLELPIERKIKYMANLYSNAGETEKAVPLYEQLLKSTDTISWHDAVRGLLYCLLSLKRYKQAINLISECAVKNPNYLMGLPVKNVLSEIEALGKHDLWQDISLSIVYHVYSKLVGADKDGVMAVACEKFLKTNGYKRPSEIDVNKFNRELLIYYLKKVCVISVLDSSFEYSSSEEVEKERILVCQILSLIDVANKGEYSNEIKKITQRIAIKQSIRKIEDSKIYVDTDGIKATLAKTLNESFERFKSIERHDLDEFVTSLKSIMPDLDVRIFNDEKNELFRSMFLEFRNHFTVTEFGLENCLSTGIRHGVLAANIRKPLEVANLITLRDAITGKYLENEFWKRNLDLLDSKDLEFVMGCLGDFSRAINQLSEMLRTKWLQIKTEDRNEEGLFNFKIVSEEIELLKKECEMATSFEEFAELILAYLWEVTNRGLINIRQSVEIDFKRKINNAFDELQKNIASVAVSNKNVCNELLDSITKARTDLQYELNRIASWFERSGESKIADFEIELPISIGVEIINNINPRKRIEPTSEITSQRQLKGQTLRSFVDIIYILLENAVKHSGLPKEELNLSIKCADKQGSIELIIENAVSQTVKEAANHDSIAQLETAVNDGVSLDKARSEGGSGYFKIAKIMKYDLKCPYNINFNFTEIPSFQVMVDIDIKEVLA